MTTTKEFGLEARKEFMLEPGTNFTNHGSYGTIPTSILEERIKLIRETEVHPDRWFRSKLRPLYDENLAALAKFVGADPGNIAFVNNATTGINTILKNLILGPEDIILLNNHTYAACSKAADSAVRRTSADMLTLDIILPVRSEDQLIDQVVETCKRNVGIRLAIIDHISSPSGIVFPIQKIVKELHKLGVWVLVDGAHGPGQISLNLEELQADFYVGNFHKWCYAPRGCAFLWVNSKHRDSIQPLVTSHNYKRSFGDQFQFQGTLDYTPYLVTKEAIKFHSSYGGIDGITGYTNSLLDWAQQMLCHAFNTQVLPIPPSMQAPNMRVLRLPKFKDYSVCQEDCEIIMTKLSENEGGCVGCVTCFSGHLWLRISANVYNVKEEYVNLKNIINDMIDTSA